MTRWLSRNYLLVAGTSLALPALIGLAAGGRDEDSVLALGQAAFGRRRFQQFTWAVSSYGHHVHGAHEPGSRDQSRDNGWTLPILGGEGLHNYHHRYPFAAVNAPIYLDPLGMLLTVAERLGLVWDLKRVR